MALEGHGSRARAGCSRDLARTAVLRRASRSSVALAAAALAQTAASLELAQGVPPRAIAIVPMASVQLTATDNYRATVGGERSADLITQLSAGVAAQLATAHTRGFLDYQLAELLYARHGSERHHTNTLNSGVHADLLDGRFTLDAGASIARQAVSAFGSANTAPGAVNPNATETRTVQVTPAIVGQLAGVLAYRGQIDWARTSASGQTVGNAETTGAGLHVQPVNRAKLTWTADVQHSGSRYRDGRDTSSDRFWLGSVYDWSELDLSLGANAGWERSNLLSLDSRSKTTWGASFAWAPSPRTRADLRYDQRQFGHSYAAQLQYRTPLTVWRASSTRDLSTAGTTMVAGARSPAYDLFFQQLASVEPDPLKRNDLVLALLQRANLDRNALITVGYLTSAATITDRTELSAAWRLARDTAVLSLVRSRARRVDAVSGAADDLSATPQIVSTLVSLNLSHQLTPQSALALNVSVTDNRGDGTSPQRNRYQQYALQWSASVWRDVSVGLGLRRGQTFQASQSATENALTASLTARF